MSGSVEKNSLVWVSACLHRRPRLPITYRSFAAETCSSYPVSFALVPTATWWRKASWVAESRWTTGKRQHALAPSTCLRS